MGRPGHWSGRGATFVVAAALLATAAQPRVAVAGSGTGVVEVPVASPTPARVASLATPGANGTVGFVLSLGGRVPDGTPYTLTRTAGIGPVDLDVWFYADLVGTAGEGVPCRPTGREGGPPEPDASGGETGRIWCGDADGDGVFTTSDQARYAVVFLFTGARASFRLTW